MKAYHYSATAQLSGGTSLAADGIIHVDGDPFSDDFMPQIRTWIAGRLSDAAGFTLPVEKTTVHSLTLLAERHE